MGCSHSIEEVDSHSAKLYDAMFNAGSIPDIGIEEKFVTYLGMNASEALIAQHQQILDTLGSQASTYVKDVLSIVGGVANIPNAVGIIALILSIILDIAMAANKKEEPDVKQLLRSVFAEEKVSEIGNLMEIYMERSRMYFGKTAQMRKVTEDYEGQLHLQLVRVKNSILEEGHITHRALKHWVNGAALHVGMLIYLAKLDEDTHRPAAALAIDTYQNQLGDILEKYKAYVPSTLSCNSLCTSSYQTRRRRQMVYIYITPCTNYVVCSDKETTKKAYYIGDGVPSACYDRITQTYASILFQNNEQITKMRAFFEGMAQNLNSLIKANHDFQAQLT